MTHASRPPLQRPLRAPARHGRVSLERALGELANVRFELEHARQVVALKNRRIDELEAQVASLRVNPVR